MPACISNLSSACNREWHLLSIASISNLSCIPRLFRCILCSSYKSTIEVW